MPSVASIFLWWVKSALLPIKTRRRSSLHSLSSKSLHLIRFFRVLSTPSVKSAMNRAQSAYLKRVVVNGLSCEVWHQSLTLIFSLVPYIDIVFFRNSVWLFYGVLGIFFKVKYSIKVLFPASFAPKIRMSQFLIQGFSVSTLSDLIDISSKDGFTKEGDGDLSIAVSNYSVPLMSCYD